MIQKTLTSFDLKQIADSGQCFRMLPAEEANTYTVISGPHFLKAAQDGQTVTFFCEPEELPFWERYFDLDTDYDAFRKAINPRDAYLKQAADFGQGVRILRQDLWEMIITFIISQQQTIPSIRRRVEDLSHAYGSRLPVPGTFYSFPSPEQLSAASLEDLLAMKLGYRAKYIKRVCEDACSGRLDLSYLSQLHLPFRPPPHRRLPCGHMDPENPHEPVRPQKPSSKRSSPVQGLRGSDTETFFPVPRLCRSHAAVYFLL